MSKKDELINNLNEALAKIIAEGEEETFMKKLPYDEAASHLKEVPDYIPKGEPFRVVKLSKDDLGCPCGGTHVKKIADIEEMKITKIVKKGKNTRVSYTVKGSK